MVSYRARGWEFTFGHSNEQIRQVKYNIGGSLSDAWSKVLELANNENVPNEGKNENRLIVSFQASEYACLHGIPP